MKSKRVVVGIHAAKEVLKVRPKAVVEMWLRRDSDRHPDLKFFADWAKRQRVKCLSKDEGALSRLAASHQGVALFVDETPTADLEQLAQGDEKKILVALDEITDPHNIGAILRTAWLMGAAALIVPEHRSGHLTPAVIKVASGGAEHVPLVVVRNLPNVLKSLKDSGFWVYGLAGEGAQELSRLNLNEKVIWVVGSEEKGLRSTVRSNCDELVKIPQTSAEASYNASVAAAIALYETVRQHRLSSQ